MMSMNPQPTKGIKFRKSGTRIEPALTNGPFGYVLRARDLASQVKETYEALLKKRVNVQVKQFNKYLDYLVLKSRNEPDRFVWVYENFYFEEFNQERFAGNADGFVNESIHLHEDTLPNILSTFGHELGIYFGVKLVLMLLEKKLKHFHFSMHGVKQLERITSTNLEKQSQSLCHMNSQIF